MEILFVDVQAVGSPGKGFPLEVAWKSTDSGVRSFFFRMKNPEIPPRIRRLTGIDPDDLSGIEALPADEIVSLFLAAAGIPDSPAVLVAHHAVYEKKWLDHLTGLDLKFTCTRQMALERIDNLRSTSLRAVAGVTGNVIGSLRRASSHVLVTEAVYFSLVRGFSHVPMSREERLSLPEVSGVYRFLDSGGNILYTGKARNIRRRVNSHFTGRASGRKGEMLSRISSVEIQKTPTPFHAAVLESQQISTLSPEYNRAGIILAPGLWYLSGDMTRILEESGEAGSFGPFLSRSQIEGFALLNAAMASAENVSALVENLFPDIPGELFWKVFEDFRKAVLESGMLRYGIALSARCEEEGNDDEEAHEEVVDEAYVEKRLNGLAAFGTHLCRRGAAVRLLAGCRIKWTDENGSGVVHNFVENSVTEELDQVRARKLMVVLSELRRVYAAGCFPELTVSSGIVLKGEPLKKLLDAV